ncbi:MAG: hypothetical protein M1832_004305 [Thelocarpon impressellum]|nr:MAG: hypothetical protein M1832_004305 [Thelocarpon impressellum]
MPFVFTNETGQRFPKKTLTVDVYASRLDQGILTPNTKSLGFKTYLDKTPTSPFFVDEEPYLEAFKCHWVQVVAEIAPSYGLSVAAAFKAIEAASLASVPSSPLPLADGVESFKALASVDPAIITGERTGSEDGIDIANAITNALRQSAETKGFVAVEAMATRPTVQVNGLPSLSEDAAAETMSPGEVDRVARKREVLNKLRPDAYPLHHSWVMWHERLDRALKSAAAAAAKAAKSSYAPTPVVNKQIQVPLATSVQDSKGLQNGGAAGTNGTLAHLSGSLAPGSVFLQQPSTAPQHSSTPEFDSARSHGQDNSGSAVKADTKPAYEDTLMTLQEISTIKMFWQVNNNFNLSSLVFRDTIHLFKKSVKPVWEDPRNVRGGSWTFRINKLLSGRAWQDLQLMAVGEKLQEAVEPGDDICGVSFSVRFSSHLLSVWNRDASNQKSIDAIKEVVLSELPEELRPGPTQIYYKKHSEHKGFSEAIAANKAKAEAEEGTKKD